MSELARRRNARDLWISRGHLAAAASGAASLAVASFAVGFFLGEHRRTVVVEPAPFAPDEGLVELLARIETTAALPGGVDEAMTFPDLLRSESTPSVPPPEPPPEPRIVLGAARPGPPGAVGGLPAEPPPGAFTGVVGRGGDAAEVRAEVEDLRRRGLAAWVSVAVVDGAWSYRIAVGGFDDEATARQALGLARVAGVPGAVEPILLTPPERGPPAVPEPEPEPEPVVPAPALEAPVDPLEVEEPGLVAGPDEAEVVPVEEPGPQ